MARPDVASIAQWLFGTKKGALIFWRCTPLYAHLRLSGKLLVRQTGSLTLAVLQADGITEA
jgi:hypothetical protein